ncbi:unnamed protein product [Fraxinus pennsylvanica]|uniref:Uncharacterized protein n=1 Tax=Fraxinus pennsylvanica TaxID=56036 RepID=A0AAD1ZKV3_9LAMI|nr:unnamed protein product [Fraxinus pennsylvanica]
MLKRSKVTTKKGSAVSSQPEGPRRRSEFDEMVDKCLSATSPVRFLKAKEKAREAEGERENGTSMDLITLGVVDADKISKYELTVEDGRRLAKDYSRILMRKHRARQAAE